MTAEPSVEEILAAGERDGLFDAAALAVAPAGEPTRCWSLGTATVFDLASLTKPLSTGALAAQALTAGLLRLDDPVSRWFPAFAAGAKAAVTVEHLLRHDSGMPAFRRWYTQLPAHADDAAAREIAARAAAEPLETDPGAQTRYSDIGFIVLSTILEAVLGEDLAAAFFTRVAAPLGLAERLVFAPLSPEKRNPVAPTGFDPWRGRVLHGEVHDATAFLLGSHAPHAGLFGNAAAVADLARLWITGVDRGLPGVDAAWVRAFVAIPADGRRPLAWDRTGPGPSQAGRRVSPAAFGHLGFTGTALWIDPHRRTAVVLLTNRVAHDLPGERFRAWRPQLYDAVWAMLDRGDTGDGGGIGSDGAIVVG